ncbi:MAG TPA: FAD:protein FMN transferase [Planctomycetota bacterium]|nr:FAD:protein FMN transferase [Planctomycetota bacterium]
MTRTRLHTPNVLLLLAACAGCGAPPASEGPTEDGGDFLTTVYMSEEEALRTIFPSAARVVREEVVLTVDERRAIEDVIEDRLGERAFTVHAGVKEDGSLDGFAVVQAEIGKFKLFHFIVGVEPDVRVRRVAVLVYRESRGGEVASRRFLEQYHGKRAADPIRIQRDIINISGATMSVNSMNHGVKKVLALLDVVYRRRPERTRRLLAAPPPARDASSAAAPHPHAAGGSPIEARGARHVMGSLCEIRVWGADSARLAASISRAFLAVEEADRALSDYRPESELSRVSRDGARQAVEVSGLTEDFLALAEQLWRASGGAFDITLGPAVEAWGFRGGAPRSPSMGELEAVRRRVGQDKVHLERGERRGARVRLDAEGMRLDPGGLGKGFAADLAARSLEEDGVPAALVDFAGNMYALGAPPGQAGWVVAVRDPSRPASLLGTVTLHDAGISSSGSHEKSIVIDGVRRGHILSPATLRPTAGAAAACVVAPTAALADGWSTAACVLGEKAIPLLEGEEGIEGTVAIECDGGERRLIATRGWRSSPLVLAEEKLP